MKEICFFYEAMNLMVGIGLAAWWTTHCPDETYDITKGWFLLKLVSGK